MFLSYIQHVTVLPCLTEGVSELSLNGSMVSSVSLFLLPADDHQALIWDIQQMPRAIEDPILAYTAEGEINNVQWASTQPDWIAICYNNCLEILRV